MKTANERNDIPTAGSTVSEERDVAQTPSAEESNLKVKALVFTDPYCSWCWGTEPMILTMMERYRDQLHMQYVFGGLIRDLDDFYDATNDIRDAAAVEPHWAMVSERTGQPIDEKLWRDIGEIRHFSSWPANVAGKAAFLQGEKQGFDYLRRLRRAALTERTIISNEEEYNRLAREVPSLDYDAFRAALDSGDAERAFQKDQETCAIWQAYGFPTILFYRADVDVNDVSALSRNNAVYVGGHRSMDTYDAVIHKLVPDIKSYDPRPEEELLELYGPMTDRELAQIFDRDTASELEVLGKLEEQGKISRSERVRGNIWSVNKLE
ncbi:MAG: DsbA family protein [Coriobacteriales bacterium]|jgi:putative protein-disulfide isomerase